MIRRLTMMSLLSHIIEHSVKTTFVIMQRALKFPIPSLHFLFAFGDVSSQLFLALSHELAAVFLCHDELLSQMNPTPNKPFLFGGCLG